MVIKVKCKLSLNTNKTRPKLDCSNDLKYLMANIDNTLSLQGHTTVPDCGV